MTWLYFHLLLKKTNEYNNPKNWWACRYLCQILYFKIWMTIDMVWSSYKRISCTTIVCIFKGHTRKIEVDFWWACEYWIQILFVKIWMQMYIICPSHIIILSTTICVFKCHTGKLEAFRWPHRGICANHPQSKIGIH